MRAVVTVIGKDQFGIIAGVSTLLTECVVNILDINQTVMQDFFTMIMLVDLSKMNVSFDSLKDLLNKKGEELKVSVRIQHEDIFKSMHKI